MQLPEVDLQTIGSVIAAALVTWWGLLAKNKRATSDFGNGYSPEMQPNGYYWGGPLDRAQRALDTIVDEMRKANASLAAISKRQDDCHDIIERLEREGILQRRRAT